MYPFNLQTACCFDSERSVSSFGRKRSYPMVRGFQRNIASCCRILDGEDVASTEKSGGKSLKEEGFKRKLAAILSTDVQEYSRLMNDDEDETISTLSNYREAMTTLIQKHRAEW